MNSALASKKQPDSMSQGFSFELSEMHRMVRDTVRGFAENEIKPVAKELDEKEQFSEELIIRRRKTVRYGQLK